MASLVGVLAARPAPALWAQATGRPVADACRPAPFDSVTPTAFVNAMLIDGSGAAPRPGMTVMITGQHIVDVFPTGTKMMVATTQMIDLEGRYLIPGLIDTHAHVATDPAGEDSRERTERRLCNALLGGVTTIRDMAGDVRALGSLARDALVGAIVSPDLHFVALFASPAFFDDPRAAAAAAGAVPGTLPWMRGVTDTTDLRQALAEARGTGATAIKIYFGLDAKAVEGIVTEAHRQGMPVWSHLMVRPADPMAVVEAGADVVSHATHGAYTLGAERARALLAGATEPNRALEDPAVTALLEAMRRRGTILDATLFILQDQPDRLRVAAALVRRAHDVGVLVSAGTDSLASGDGPDITLPNLHRELQLLVEVGGFTPSEALLAATRTAAAAAGAAESRGTIEVGKLADLVVLRADPTADIRNTTQIELVIKRGRIHHVATSP